MEKRRFVEAYRRPFQTSNDSLPKNTRGPPNDPIEPVITPVLAERYRALLDVGATLLASSDSAELYEAIYTEAAKVVDFAGFMLSIYDAQNDLATVVLSVVDGAKSESGITYRGSDSEVLRNGVATTIEDQTNSGPLFPGEGEQDMVRSTLCIPLLSKDRVTALLTVYATGADQYDDDDADLLSHVADVAALALENMRHVEELRRRSCDAERLEEIGRLLSSSLDFDEVLDRVACAAVDLLSVDGAGVWTHEEGFATIRMSVGEARIPIGTTWVLSDAISEVLLRQAKPFVIEDASSDDSFPQHIREHFDSGSALSTPIVVGERVLGALSVRSSQAKRFDAYDVQLLQRLAGQASVALENAEMHSAIHAASLTDSLTGLPNRRHLQTHLEREFAAAERGRKLVVVMFDLDGFKQYNDTLGHVVGDQILCEFAGILAHENRAMNLVARFGGDEFVSVLSEGDQQAARGYEARIHARVKANPVLASHAVTVSAGIAEYTPGTTARIEDLIQMADRSMYESKPTKV